jgi:hypothetical protein
MGGSFEAGSASMKTRRNCVKVREKRRFYYFHLTEIEPAIFKALVT